MFNLFYLLLYIYLFCIKLLYFVYVFNYLILFIYVFIAFVSYCYQFVGSYSAISLQCEDCVLVFHSIFLFEQGMCVTSVICLNVASVLFLDKSFTSNIIECAPLFLRDVLVQYRGALFFFYFPDECSFTFFFHHSMKIVGHIFRDANLDGLVGYFVVKRVVCYGNLYTSQ